MFTQKIDFFMKCCPFDSTLSRNRSNKIFFSLSLDFFSFYLQISIDKSLTLSFSLCQGPPILLPLLTFSLTHTHTHLHTHSLWFLSKSHQNWGRLNSFICGSVVRRVPDSYLTENQMEWKDFFHLLPTLTSMFAS